MDVGAREGAVSETGAGQVIVLHGASSSGKSTLAAALQQELPVPFLRLSFDTLRDTGALPDRSIFPWQERRAFVFSGLHRAVAAFATAGNNVIFEHILDTPGFHADLSDALAGLDVLMVGVQCRLETLVAREVDRGDRTIGSAEQDFHKVHKGMRYDLEVDGEGDARTESARIIAAWNDKSRRVFPTGIYAA